MEGRQLSASATPPGSAPSAPSGASAPLMVHWSATTGLTATGPALAMGTTRGHVARSVHPCTTGISPAFAAHSASPTQPAPAKDHAIVPASASVTSGTSVLIAAASATSVASATMLAIAPAMLPGLGQHVRRGLTSTSRPNAPIAPGAEFVSAMVLATSASAWRDSQATIAKSPATLATLWAPLSVSTPSASASIFSTTPLARSLALVMQPGQTIATSRPGTVCARTGGKTSTAALALQATTRLACATHSATASQRAATRGTARIWGSVSATSSALTRSSAATIANFIGIPKTSSSSTTQIPTRTGLGRGRQST
mmetsp:Transcript_152647/g.387861  ORF Transcript_152647/g.387861 Transcript_152647/m.387861 type:complete len:314 (-) Transcript_152647:1039-1980(-)